MYERSRKLAASATVMSVCFCALGQEAEQPVEDAVDAIAEEIEPAQPLSFWEGWTGNVAVGLNGASGNTERFNLRGAISGTRDTEFIETSASALYAYGTDDGDVSESRFFANARNDWKLKESKWRIFAEGSFEFDDSQDWDYRLSAAVGPGYEFIDNEKTQLLGRVGLGLSEKIGGSDTAIRPEALIGADFSHQLTERQKLIADATLYPDLSETGEFRFVGNAAWEMLIDPEVNMSLRLGVEDRYDSMPGGDSKKNDVAYFAMLVWEF